MDNYLPNERTKTALTAVEERFPGAQLLAFDDLNIFIKEGDVGLKLPILESGICHISSDNEFDLNAKQVKLMSTPVISTDYSGNKSFGLYTVICS